MIQLSLKINSNSHVLKIILFYILHISFHKGGEVQTQHKVQSVRSLNLEPLNV